MPESWGCGLYTSTAYTRVFTVLIIYHKLNYQVNVTLDGQFVVDTESAIANLLPFTTYFIIIWVA